MHVARTLVFFCGPSETQQKKTQKNLRVDVPAEVEATLLSKSSFFLFLYREHVDADSTKVDAMVAWVPGNEIDEERFDIHFTRRELLYEYLESIRLFGAGVGII